MRNFFFISLLAVWFSNSTRLAEAAQPPVASTVYNVSNVVELLHMNPKLLSSANLAGVVVYGLSSTQKFGAGRLIRYDPSSSAPEESGCVYAPTNGVGRWKFVDCEGNVPFSPMWFGGSPEITVIPYTNRLTWQGIMIDSLPAIQSAINSVSARGGGVVELDAGEWRIGSANGPKTIELKPNVVLQGSGIPTTEQAYQETYTATNVSRNVQMTMIHQANSLLNGNGNGTGVPMLAAHGFPYYTNKLSASFLDANSEWVSYYRSGNAVRNIGFWSGWCWGWNDTNAAASIVHIDEAAEIVFDNVFFGPTAGPNVYARGAFGLKFFDCFFTSGLAGGLVVVDSSDTFVSRTTFSGISGAAISYTGELNISQGTYQATANTHRINNIAIWNNDPELSGWRNLSRNTTNVNTIEVSDTPRTEYTADPVLDVINIPVRAGTDTGLPVYIRGTNIPGGLNTNTVYYVRWGVQNGTYFYLCNTSGRALHGGAVVDITSTGGTNTWWIESPSAMIYASSSEEIHLSGSRLDQSFEEVVEIQRAPRVLINGNMIWEFGFNQTETRKNKKHTFRDPVLPAIVLREVNTFAVSGNLISGTKENSGLTTPWIHEPIGILVSNSRDGIISGNIIDRVSTGVYVDADSANVSIDPGQFGAWVLRPVDSQSAFVPSHIPYFDGRTNSQIVGVVPTSMTNIVGDWAVAIKARVPDMSTNGFAAGQHSPLFNLSALTNVNVNYGALSAPRSVSYTFYKSPVDGTTFFSGIHVGTNYPGVPYVDDDRYGIDVTPWVGKDVELLVQRSGTNLQLFLNGFQKGSRPLTTWIQTGVVHAPFFISGQLKNPQPGGSNYFSQAPIYGLALHRQSFTQREINAGYPWGSKGGQAPVVLWKFDRDSMPMGVYDWSGNGVNGIVQSNGVVAPQFGPSSLMSLVAGSNVSISRLSPLQYLISSSGGGGGGLSDGTYGDIVVSGGATVMTVGANAVALSTDTTGNYLAGLSGTANEVSVSGSGSEGATPTVSLPATIDLSGKTSLRVPANSAPTIANAGEIAFDTDLWGASRGGFVGYDGTAAIRSIFVLASDTPVNGQTIKYNTGGFFTFEDDLQGGGGVSDGDKGDITISGSGTTYSVDPDAVALGTDTTGNYVATIAGTANEITVTGSGSESAATTLSIPATVDLSGKTYLRLPANSAPTVDVTGKIAFDTDLWAASRAGLIAYDGTSVIRFIGVLASDTPANGDVIKFNTGGTFTFEPDNAGGVSDGDKGDITVSGSGTTFTVDNSAITYAKIQNVSASKILGRGDSGAGAPQELTIGSGLSIVGTTISVTATSGGTATPGVISRSATTVTVQNTTTETELLDVVIPGGTLNANGDEVEVYVPSKYTMYTGQVNAYRWDFYLDYNDTPTATSGDYTGLAFISTSYAQLWTARIKRISSTTCTVMVRHVLGSDGSSDKTNVIDQLRFIKDYTLTGSKTFANDFNIGLTVTLGEANTLHRVDTAGYTVSKVGVGGGSAKMQIAHFTAMDNQPPAANYATFNTRNSMAVLEFDPSTEESARGVFVIPEGADLSGGIKVKIFWTTAATSGDVRWGAQIMRLNTDIDTDSFDTAVEATTTCNATSGIPATTSLTITTIDGSVVGDPIAVRIYRDVTDAADTVNANDAQLLAADISAVN